MASFYGNMKNNSRASFIFDKIYPSRFAMEEALNATKDGVVIGDGIFINRYVLVDYHYTLLDDLTNINEDELNKYYKKVDSTRVNTGNYSSFFIKQVGENNQVSYVSATGYDPNGTYYIKNIFVDRYCEPSEGTETTTNQTTNNLLENSIYARHRMSDWEAYRASYDCTVWMKIYADNKERYILVGELTAKAPVLEFIDDAPSCESGSGHVDQRLSTDLNYVYYMPKNWDIILNEYNPYEYQIENVEDFSDIDDYYYYYEQNLQNKSFNSSVEYPYFNKAGFDKKVRTKVNEENSGIFFKPVKSSKKYPVHKYVHAGVLTKDTYLPNKYYKYIGEKEQVNQDEDFDPNKAYYRLISSSTNGQDIPSYELIYLILGNDGKYKPAKEALSGTSTYYCDKYLDDPDCFLLSTQWENNTAYYEITWQFNNGQRQVDHKEDTYRVDVYFPIIGNTISDMLDLIYGQPRIAEGRTESGYNNLIGYCSEDQIAGYQTSTDVGSDDVPCQLQGYASIYYLTNEDIEALSPELMLGYYDIPVYAANDSNIRPYSDEKLYSGLIPPYDNLSNQEVSFGWMMTLLKQYLAELRYLSGDGGGFKSDWSQSDPTRVGYILNKPNIITTYLEVPEEESFDYSKTYYERVIKNGQVYFNKLEEIVGYCDQTVLASIISQQTVGAIAQKYKVTVYDNQNIPTTYYPTNEQIETTFASSFVDSPDSEHPFSIVKILIPDNIRNSGNGPAAYGYFTLPKTELNGNNITLTTQYIQCNENTEYNPNVDYFMSNGFGGYTAGQTSTIVYDFTTITENELTNPNNTGVNAEGLVSYPENQYIVVKDENNNIIRRQYGCEVMHTLDSYKNVGLYYGIENNEEIVGIPVRQFFITTVGSSTDAVDLYTIDNPITTLTYESTKTEALNYLNDTILLSQNNYNALIEITADYTINDWPILESLADDKEGKFFYATVESHVVYSPLTEEYFNNNKTRFYTAVTVPVENDMFEIHNIWDSVQI